MVERAIPAKIIDIAMRFVNAGSSIELKRLVSEHRKELLTDEADAAIERLILQYRDSEKDLAHLRTRRALLAHCRERGIEAAFDRAAGSSSLEELVNEFVNLREVDELLKFVREHEAELLSPAAVSILAQLETYYRDDETIVAFLQERRQLLAKCRDLGIKQAFSGEIVEIPERLGNALARFMQASNAELREVLKRDSDELLTDEAEQLLGFIVSGMTDRASADAFVFRARLELLRRCRLDGIDAALDASSIASVVGAPTPETGNIPAELLHQFNTEVQALQENDGSISEARMRALVERRPEFAPILMRMHQSGQLHWRPPTDRTALASMIAELKAAEGAQNWDRVVAIGAEALQRSAVDPDSRVAAMVHVMLGAALSNMLQGDRASNLDKAIEHYESARPILLANADGNESERGLWATNEHHLAFALRQRVRGDHSQNVEAAIKIWRELIAKTPPESRLPQWTTGLAEALRLRQIGETQRNVEEAAKLLDEAVASAEASGDQREVANARVAKGLHFLTRPSGDPATDIERAIEQLTRGSDLIDRRAELASWANVQRALAHAYTQRLLGNSVENWRIACEIMQRVAAIYSKEQSAELWAEARLGLATLMLEDPEGRSIRNTTEAMATMKETLGVYTPLDFPDRWAKVHYNIASLHCALFDASDDVERFDQARYHVEQALTIYTRDRSPELWARSHNVLGKLHMHRAELLQASEREKAADIAIDHFERALEVRTLATDPVGRIETLRCMASIRFRHRLWRAALALYVDCMRTSDRLLGVASTEVARISEVGSTAWIYSSAAYCLDQTNDATAALICLDWGKGRLLAETLATRDLDLLDLPPFVIEQIRASRREVRRLELAMRAASESSPETFARLGEALQQARLTLTDAATAATSESKLLNHTRLTPRQLLEAVPEPGALVVPLLTIEGATVYVLTRSRSENVQFVRIELPAGTRSVIRSLIWGEAESPGWRATYRSWCEGKISLSTWRQMIDSLLGSLWELILHPVAELLDTRLAPGSDIVIVPQGELAFLPFHAAGPTTEQAFLLERFTIRYAPSIFSLHASERRLLANSGKKVSALAAINPTTDLPLTEGEAEALKAAVPPADLRILRGTDASRRMIEATAAAATHLHFACHGHYDHNDIMRSGLVLSDGALTLSTILGSEVDLNAARLVTLSACETGLYDFQRSSDEFVGLPTAFLEGGACGVVSTLWPVADRATSLLMHQFYRAHLVDGLTPAQALRRAQLWLRGATRAELAEFHLAQNGSDTLERQEAFLELTIGGNADERPYEHPYYWAAFHVVGA